MKSACDSHSRKRANWSRAPYNLRADVLRELLRRCTSIKTVRLCLQLGRKSRCPGSLSSTRPLAYRKRPPVGVALGRWRSRA